MAFSYFIGKHVPSANKGTRTNYTVTCLGPCKNIGIALSGFSSDVDLFARYSVHIYHNNFSS